MYDMKISLREGVRAIAEDIRSELFPDILDFVSSKKIRKGFEDFLFYLQEMEIPFVIISGGFKPVIELLTEPFREKITAIYGLDVDLTAEKIKIKSAYEDGDEMVAKTNVMSLYNVKEVIAIGDSLTDINMAINSDIVFARDRLAKYLEERNVRFKEWKNFIDIRNELGFRLRASQ